MKRTPIGERPLPNYTRSQELANMWTHIAGVLLGLALLPIIILKSRGRWRFSAAACMRCP